MGQRGNSSPLARPRSCKINEVLTLCQYPGMDLEAACSHWMRLYKGRFGLGLSDTCPCDTTAPSTTTP